MPAMIVPCHARHAAPPAEGAEQKKAGRAQLPTANPERTVHTPDARRHTAGAHARWPDSLMLWQLRRQRSALSARAEQRSAAEQWNVAKILLFIFQNCTCRPQPSAPLLHLIATSVLVRWKGEIYHETQMTRLAAVEGGGTTFVVAIALNDPTNVVDRAEFPTTSPKETLQKCCDWLSQRRYDALGVACFGPVDLKKGSPTYGYITTTPKPGWKNTNILGPLRAVRPSVPIAFDTDVNAPAMAEYEHALAEAKARGDAILPTSCAYITVGTGIGVGLVVNGATVHGLMHPEGGHLCVPQRAADASFEGPNPADCFGGLCAENMACAGSLAKRASLGSSAGLASLRDDDPAWDAAAHYLGALCANIVLLASPERIVLSGGVMQRASLFPRVRSRMQAMLNGYIQVDQIATAEGIERYITPSTWGNRAGLTGALTLAVKALEEQATAVPSKAGSGRGSTIGVLVVALGAALALATFRAAAT